MPNIFSFGLLSCNVLRFKARSCLSRNALRGNPLSSQEIEAFVIIPWIDLNGMSSPVEVKEWQNISTYWAACRCPVRILTQFKFKVSTSYKFTIVYRHRLHDLTIVAGTLVPHRGRIWTGDSARLTGDMH